MSSIGYSLVKLVLKLKGEKKSWSQDPIDYRKKRKQDVHTPNTKLLLGSIFETKEIYNSKVTSIAPKNTNTDFLLLYCHGGAFVYGPTQENWIAIAKIAKQARSHAWMVDYPKAPENTIKTITESIYQVYLEAIKTYNPSKIILIGDSVGGNLIMTLTQRLLKEKYKLPNRLIAITPMIDASLTNPKIEKIDLIDPILSIKGVKSAKKMCAGQLSLKDQMISPIYGDFDDFPTIHLFTATNDICTPDQEMLIDKIKKAQGEIEVIKGKGMPHIWPILPILSEAKIAIKKIVSIINLAIDDE
ncbi:acetyl esterase/lipase [Aquimarina sp. EL_43]|uniref:alpha/beta hydrolase n=1 Tax=unclassified Aquimarina TaxID=2627091 RepID=UPI0018C96E2A|nr:MULTISPECIES: alpha/beta hydrolase [unclassified Aquimarina]MBG6129541.1 acetyl esterase/lipase [Aquimarina sp. EL_35]MBG6150606.1 acetyl esterase/lipase [Aquimarina sp. EL_32]MBG6168086.1 acetyl esterase/lipase [Aquimarina sp. EL_43]